MNKISNLIVRSMVEKDIINFEVQDEYKYAIETLLEQSITYTVLIALGVYFKELIPTVVFLIYFVSIRKRTGGFHLNTYNGCLFSTLIIYIAFVKFIYPFFKSNISLAYILLLLSTIFIFIIGSINHPKVNWNREEILESRKSSREIVVLQFFSILILGLLEINIECFIFAVFAVFLCAISIVLAKISGQEVKDSEKEILIYSRKNKKC